MTSDLEIFFCHSTGCFPLLFPPSTCMCFYLLVGTDFHAVFIGFLHFWDRLLGTAGSKATTSCLVLQRGICLAPCMRASPGAQGPGILQGSHDAKQALGLLSYLPISIGQYLTFPLAHSFADIFGLGQQKLFNILWFLFLCFLGASSVLRSDP